MSLSDLASLGSFVSGLAVIVTLVFLLIQMRQIDRNQRSSMQLGRAVRHNDLVLRQTDPEIARVFVKAVSDPESLNDVETQMFCAFIFADFQNWEDTFIQHRAGLIDAEGLESDEARLRVMLRNPAYRAMWQIVAQTFGHRFRAYVDGVMTQLSPTRQTMGMGLTALFKAAAREQAALLSVREATRHHGAP
jgi:hypothetical protein